MRVFWNSFVHLRAYFSIHNCWSTRITITRDCSVQRNKGFLWDGGFLIGEQSRTRLPQTHSELRNLEKSCATYFAYVSQLLNNWPNRLKFVRNVPYVLNSLKAENRDHTSFEKNTIFDMAMWIISSGFDLSYKPVEQKKIFLLTKY